MWRLSEPALVTTTRAVCQRITDLEALRVRLVVDQQARGTAKTLGAGSTASWLSGVTRMAPVAGNHAGSVGIIGVPEGPAGAYGLIPTSRMATLLITLADFGGCAAWAGALGGGGQGLQGEFVAKDFELGDRPCSGVGRLVPVKVPA